MAQVVNVVLITAQLSSMNSAVYVASRSLVSLASSGRAPRFFARTTKNGTPVPALVLSNGLGLIAMLNYKTGPALVFTYLINISGSATFIAWAIIGVIHLRFRRAWKAQGHEVKDLPYRAMFFPYGTLFVVFINTFLVIIAGYANFIDGFDTVGFVVNYVVIAVFVVLFVGWKVIKRTKAVPLLEMDLVTGRKFLSGQEPELEKRNVAWYVKVKRFVFS
jgi:amino acid transporter